MLHVPHAGTLIPDDVRRSLLLDDEELKAEISRMTDWHTDLLALDALAALAALAALDGLDAAGAAGTTATVFANRLSRLVVDPERFLDDSEPMAAVGMGAVYRMTSDLRPLRNPDPAEEDRLLERFFHPYAAAFERLISDAIATHGQAIIVDLHSFPSAALPYELEPLAHRPGICLGTDPIHTHQHLLDAAVEAFDGVAGGVTENSPFSGTYVPHRHWRKHPQVGSIMIEVRRDLYQTEPGGARHAGYGDVVRRIASFLSTIVHPTGDANPR